MNTVLLRLLPGAVLLVTLTVALHSVRLRAAAGPLLPAYPLVVLGGGILLAWRFGRSRLVFTLATLLLADRALLLWAPAAGGAGGGDVSRVVFGALAILVPLDLAALAWLPERGLLARPGRLALAVLAAEISLVALLCQPLFVPLAVRLHAPHGAFALGALAPVSLVSFAFAFVVLARRAVLQVTAMESGALWSLVAAFLALGAGGGGPDASAYFATGGLILVLSLIETWHRMAYDDELTGLPARRALNEALARLRGVYTVAMVDIDHFKRFNDEHGHDVGDQLLRMVGARLAEVGGGGHAFRYGGEEFAVLFPGKDLEESRVHLEALRHTIETAAFTLRGPHRPRARPESPAPAGARRRIAMTVSIGAAAADAHGPRADDVVRAADQALYRAKQGGRNRVCT
ncbi:MAG TPA: GGDEF domain-containing protein [Candidatus Binatia bacterium]|nr:GGDEF domain-containing protein [Candidatus Binatia bacterium]